MATNLRQIRTQLGNPANFQEVVSSLGIDTSNFTRNLSPSDEAKIRNYFAGGEQQVQDIPVDSNSAPAVLDSIRQKVSELSDTMALSFAASFEDTTLAKFASLIGTQSSPSLQRLAQQQTGQSIQRLDLATMFNQEVNNPFLSSLNQGIEGFSLKASPVSNPLAFLPQAADLSLPSLPESPENSEPSDSSNEPATAESSL